MPRTKSWIRIFASPHVAGSVLTSAHSSGTYMASMYCLLCRHADPDLTPHRLLHTSSSICLPSQTSQLTVYGNTEIKVASVALSNFTSTQFQGRDLVCPWPGLAVLVADPLNRCWESEARQMVRSRESKRLAVPPLPVTSFLLERQAPAVSNLLSSQASSFKSDEICYQGRVCFRACEKSCHDSLHPQHWGEGLSNKGFAAGESLVRGWIWSSHPWWLEMVLKPLLSPLHKRGH